MNKLSVYLVSAIILAVAIALGALKVWGKGELTDSSTSAETSLEEATETGIKKVERLEFAQSNLSRRCLRNRSGGYDA